MLEQLKKCLSLRYKALSSYALYSQKSEQQWIYLLGLLEGVFLSGTIALSEQEKKELLLWAVVLFGLEREYERQMGECFPLVYQKVLLP